MTQDNGPGSTAVEGFGSREIKRTGETAQTALAAAAQTSVNARYIMALQRPRSWDDVRVRLLKECERKGFAEVARYAKPIGPNPEKWPKGPSIRFAEACLRYAGNMAVQTQLEYEDRERRVLKILALDFETNASADSPLTIEKTVERRNKKDRVVLGERTNSYGDTVYIVEATEDELLNKVNAGVSKAARTCILRLVPGDIVEECMTKVVQVLKSGAERDPAAEKKRVCDAFGSIGVMPKDLADYLGHSLDAVQPAELVDLRQIYSTIRDGETTWAEVMEATRGEAKGEKQTASAQASGIAEKARARTAKKPPAAPPAESKPATQAPPAEPPPGAGDAWEGPADEGP